MTLLRALVALLTAALILASCAPGEDGPIVVLTASSLVDVTADLATAWGASEVLVSDAGSQVLAAQVDGGADADVILLADPAIAVALEEQGLAGPPRVAAANDLIIAVAPRAADRVRSTSDLATSGLRLVLADEGVPLGDRTREGLALAVDAGLLGDTEGVLGNVVSFEDSARVVLAKVAAHEVDAAIVYVTDALAAGDRVRTVAWPAAANVDIRYTIQDVTGARAVARTFTEFVVSPEAAPIWARHGFRSPTG